MIFCPLRNLFHAVWLGLYKVIFIPKETSCSCMFNCGLKNTVSYLSMRFAFLLFFPDAINSGTLPTIIAVPKLTGTVGKERFVHPVPMQTLLAADIAVMAKTTVPPPTSNHPPAFWPLLFLR